jgi:hypothetical protein
LSIKALSFKLVDGGHELHTPAPPLRKGLLI